MLKTKHLILLLCFTGVLSNPPNDDTDLFTKIGEKYYIIFSAVKMNWYGAANFCQRHNSDLVTIESDTELKDLHDYLTAKNITNKGFWTSATDLAEEGNFVSLSTGRPLIYTKFFVGQPDNYEEEDCLQIYSYPDVAKMNDYPCSGMCYVICEKRRVSETYTTGSCENISTDCALKTIGRAFLPTQNQKKTFDCRA